MIGFAKSIPGKIKSAFGNARGILVGIARAIVQGFRDGFGRAWDAAIAWVKGKIAGLSKAAKFILGIRSPSKVFQEIGLNVGKGMELGIEKSMPAVAAALQSLVQQNPRRRCQPRVG